MEATTRIDVAAGTLRWIMNGTTYTGAPDIEQRPVRFSVVGGDDSAACKRWHPSNSKHSIRKL